MKGKLRVLVCAALCVALGVGTAFASVTIYDKTTGKDEFLKDIDDIVMATTGTRTVYQESFFKVLKTDDENFRFYANKGSGTGSNVSLSESGAQYLNVAGERTNTGAHPAVGTKRNSDGSLFLMVPSYSASGVKASLYKVSVDVNSNVTQTQAWDSSKSVVTGDVYVTDAAGGLFPYGKDGKEVFVIAYFTSDDTQKNSSERKRPGLGTNYTAYLAFVDTEGKASTQYVGKMKGYFPSVRVAVGDFDNDGTNELAVIRDGSGADYYMQVFGVTSSLTASEKYHKSLGTRDDEEADNIDGCDIVAGDFNGDGKTDLAAIYADKINHDGYPAVTTFKWNGSGFDTQYKAESEEDLMMGSTYWTRSSYVPHFGIVAEAADLDGNGKDEIVFLTPSYNDGSGTIGEGGYVLASVWGADNGSLAPSRKFWRNTWVKIYGYGGVSGFDMAECNYLPRSISLALVPVGDKPADGGFTRRMFMGRSQGGDTVTKADNYHDGDALYYFSFKVENGSVTNFIGKDINNDGDGEDWNDEMILYKSGSAGRVQGLVHADFYCQTVELGEPEHLVFAAERSYIAEMQTPPYHVDYVQVPFEVNKVMPTGPSVLNMSYMGSKTSYSKSDEDAQKEDVTFKTTSVLDWGVKANAAIPLIGTEVTAGYKDTATNVENATSSREVRTKLTTLDETVETDCAMLYKTDRHVWRYPVNSIVPGAPEGRDMCFMTFSICDTPDDSIHGAAGQSSNFDDYNPIHEEGNLFSYPTAIQSIPYYGDKQLELTAKDTKTAGNNSTMELEVKSSGADTNGKTTTSKKVANGSTSVTITVPEALKMGTEATASYSSELTNTNTFTKSYATSEKFTVTLKTAELGFDKKKIAHDITSQLYVDAAGAMTVGFAVNLKSTMMDTAEVWAEDGMYYGKPDLALVLPSRFSRYTSNIDNVKTEKWIANDYRPSAIQLRGIRFKDQDGNPVPSVTAQDGKRLTAALVRGKKYNISIPVYNASFKAPDGPVTAEMQLRVLDRESADSDDIILTSKDITTQTFEIKGWQQATEENGYKDVNKATVSFDWTVPTNLDVSKSYVLYFILDPEHNIEELHEDWDLENDPGGNNVGCYPIGILEKDLPDYYTASTTVSTAASESDFKLLFRHPGEKDGEWISFDEFRTELAGMEEDFRAYAKVIYSGSDTLANLYLDSVRRDPDGTVARIATRVIPVLHPGMERESSFIISPEKVKKGTFSVSLTGSGTNLHWGRTSNSGTGGSGSSGGCDTGLGGVAVLALFVFAALLSSRVGKRR